MTALESRARLRIERKPLLTVAPSLPPDPFEYAGQVNHSSILIMDITSAAVSVPPRII